MSLLSLTLKHSGPVTGHLCLAFHGLCFGVTPTLGHVSRVAFLASRGQFFASRAESSNLAFEPAFFWMSPDLGCRAPDRQSRRRGSASFGEAVCIKDFGLSFTVFFPLSFVLLEMPIVSR